jgi:hypothetical protein
MMHEAGQLFPRALEPETGPHLPFSPAYQLYLVIVTAWRQRIYWMAMKTRIMFALVGCLAAAWVARPQAADDPLDSLKVCKDTQHLIFENQLVRVIDDQIPVGVTEPLHRHRHGVVVYVNTYTNEQISQSGKKTIGERKAGTASWSDETVHTVKNIGATPSHAIRIELKY